MAAPGGLGQGGVAGEIGAGQDRVPWGNPDHTLVEEGGEGVLGAGLGDGSLGGGVALEQPHVRATVGDSLDDGGLGQGDVFAGQLQIQHHAAVDGILFGGGQEGLVAGLAALLDGAGEGGAFAVLAHQVLVHVLIVAETGKQSAAEEDQRRIRREVKGPAKKGQITVKSKSKKRTGKSWETGQPRPVSKNTAQAVRGTPNARVKKRIGESSRPSIMAWPAESMAWMAESSREPIRAILAEHGTLRQWLGKWVRKRRRWHSRLEGGYWSRDLASAVAAAFALWYSWRRLPAT